MKLKDIFLSPEEPRLRAGWRLAIQSALYLILTGCLLIPFILIPAIAADWEAFLFFGSVAEVIAVTLSVALARRYLDKRTFTGLGLIPNKRAILDMLAGIGFSIGMVGLVYLIEWRFGWLAFEGFIWQVDPGGIQLNQIMLALFTFILIGWKEELLSRGYHLQNLASGLNLTWGVLISSAVFGIMHLNNPNSAAKVQVSVGIFLAGVFLAYGWLKTGQLWLPIGLHIGWNFFEGVAFGFPVSGMQTPRLLVTTVSGPEIWTGGAFGPEAGLVSIPALLLGALLVLLYTRNRSGVV